ncbi:MAG: hypothetical protein ACRETC_01160 [Gammaproteobacteria bacterium]
MRLLLLPATVLLSLTAVSAQAAAPTPATTAATAPVTTQPAPSAKTVAHAKENITLPPSAVPKFSVADTNHDGKIEWNEAQALKVPKKIFKHDDFDNNGSLNETEWLFVRLDMTDFTPATATKAPASATH